MYVAWALTTLFLWSSGHFNTDPPCRTGVLVRRLRRLFRNLRGRYRLHFGDSRVLLPPLLKQYGKIDIFLHDSLHTFEHQRFEYETAYPHIAQGGLLLSDDIFWSAAFHQFTRKKQVSYVNLGDFGAVRV